MKFKKVCVMLSLALCLSSITASVSAVEADDESLPNFYGRMDLNDEGFDDNFKLVSIDWDSPTPLDKEALLIGEEEDLQLEYKTSVISEDDEIQFEVIGSQELTTGELGEYQVEQSEVESIASTSDLAVANLRCVPYEGSNPVANVPGGFWLNYAFSISNFGDTSVRNCVVSIYFDGIYQNKTTISNLPARYRTDIAFKFPGVAPGDTIHTMTIVINEDHAIPESNYSNNTTSRQFRYTYSIELVGDSISTLNGLQSLPLNQDVEFKVTLLNVGSLTARNVIVDFPAIFTVNNQQSAGNMGSIVVPEMEAFSQIGGTVKIQFLRPASLQIGCYVNPNSTIKELIYSNNTAWNTYDIASGSTVNPTYTFELHGGFFNTRNIKYAFDPSYPTPASNYTTAIQKGCAMWNNNTSEFSLTEGTSANNNILVQVSDFGDKDWNALSGVVGGVWETAYSQTTLQINTRFFTNKQEKDIRLVVGHELGHSLGLNHVTKDSCIMYAVYDPFDKTKNKGVQDAAAKHPELFDRPAEDDIAGAVIACRNWN